MTASRPSRRCRVKPILPPEAFWHLEVIGSGATFTMAGSANGFATFRPANDGKMITAKSKFDLGEYNECSVPSSGLQRLRTGSVWTHLLSSLQRLDNIRPQPVYRGRMMLNLGTAISYPPKNCFPRRKLSEGRVRFGPIPRLSCHLHHQRSNLPIPILS